MSDLENTKPDVSDIADNAKEAMETRDTSAEDVRKDENIYEALVKSKSTTESNSANNDFQNNKKSVPLNKNDVQLNPDTLGSMPIKYIEEDDSDDTSNSFWTNSSNAILNMSKESKVIVTVIIGVLALAGLLFYIGSTTKPKEVKLSNKDNLPAVNIGGVLGSQSGPTVPNSVQQIQPDGPTYDPSKQADATTGEITLIQDIKEGSTIDTYDDEFVLAGDLGLDGAFFVFEVLVNNIVKETYSVQKDPNGLAVRYNEASLLAKPEDGHDFGKFLLRVAGLGGGNSDISLILYGDTEKEVELDRLDFTFNNLNGKKTTTVESKTRKEVTPKDFFKLIDLDLSKDKLWTYVPPVSLNWTEINDKDFEGSGKLENYKIYNVGSIDIDEETYEVYSISYNNPGFEKTYINGYIKDGKFNYFANLTNIEKDTDDVLIAYFESAEYDVKNAVSYTVSYDIEGSNNSFSGGGDIYFCTKEDLDSEVLYDSNGISITKTAKARDVFGMCRDVLFKASYFDSENFDKDVDNLDSAFKDDFNKIKFDPDDDDNIDGFYSPYEYYCSNEELAHRFRVLADKYDSHLESLGKVNDNDLEFYYLDDDSPSFSEQGLDDLIGEDDDFPMLVIDTSFDDRFLFVKHNDIKVPEC